MNAALIRIFIAGLRRRPLAAALSVLAIALGVALGLAVQLIHAAALGEFDRAMRVLAGAADLQVVGPDSGFDEAVYIALMERPEVAEASPVVEVAAQVRGLGRTLPLLGVDVFRLAHVQRGLLPVSDEQAAQLAALDPRNIFLSPAARAALGVGAGAPVTLAGRGGRVVLRLAGSVPGAGEGQVLGVMDIAAVQRQFGFVGRLTRIDLRLAAGVDPAQARRTLGRVLPAGVRLLTPAAARGQEARLSRAYRTNLTMLAAIALLTGGFLVFSTQWLAVVRRRQEHAFLRALGMDRRRLLQGLLAEGAALGLGGGILGVVLGYGLAAALAGVVGGDLGAGYFRGVAVSVQLAPLLTVAYLLLGVAAGALGALVPARRAARQPPARGLRAQDADAELGARPRRVAPLLCIAAAAGLCALPAVQGVPLAGYGAVALILVAAVLFVPDLVRLATALLPAGRGVLLRLARSRLAAAPGQAVIAGAGVVASVAVAVAMAIMVDSFRDSVDAWLARVLPADLYVRPVGGAGGAILDAASIARTAAIPGVAAVEPMRRDRVRLSDGLPPVTLIARPVPDPTLLPLVRGGAPPGAALPPVWISEAVADLYRLKVGDGMVLPITGRAQRFVVAGVWRDYVRQHGAVVVELAEYRRLTGDATANELAVRLAPGASVEEVATRVRRAFAGGSVEIASPGEIRARTLEIFDRTFVVTYLMEAVAVAIGLFGIATAFAGLAAARRREFGMLRHLGLTRGEVGRLLAVEGGVCAAVAVTAGVLAGGAIAWVLVEVVNRQSFHWSMDLHVPFAALASFALVLVLLAAAAARIAGAQAMRQSAVVAVREDW